jgi:ketosteroid isomerase-like protein
MSQQNIEIIRRAHEAYERGDWAESVKDFDSEAIAYREFPDGAMFYGPEGLLLMITDWLAGFDDFILTTPQLIDANDHQVIARTRQTAVGAGSGVRIEGEFWFVHTLRDAKIIRVDIVTSKARALEVAGLSE